MFAQLGILDGNELKESHNNPAIMDNKKKQMPTMVVNTAILRI